MNLNEKLKSEIIELAHELTGQTFDLKDITIPPKAELGDLALPMFSVAKVQGKNPVQLAQELAPKFSSKYFTKVIAAGPYINFFINSDLFAGEIIAGLSRKIQLEEGRGQKVMIEYFSPNTNKPMTVGHLRNIILGSTISRLFEKNGYKVIQACLYNDRGIAIAKSMVAYELFAKNSTPQKEKLKSDQFVGNYYVLFGAKAANDLLLEEKAKQSLLKWEAGDKKTLALWKKMYAWVIKGYAQTFSKLHEGKFDKIYRESDIYTQGRDLILNNVGNGVIKKGETGEVYADLEKFKMPNKILLRSNGTAVYITQDIYLAELKNKAKIDKSIYVVADEQNLQMQQLFAVLDSIEGRQGKYHHLSYGMMRLPDGKIKSREGFGKALADELIDNLESLALAEVNTRNPLLSVVKKRKIANQIMNAALKFYILNIDPAKTMIFSPEEAVSFSGKTGPYLQYTSVRLNKILKEVRTKNQELRVEYKLLSHPLEKQLLNKLKDYTDILLQAQKLYSPSTLAHYLYELAQLANTYYHDVPVLKAEKRVREARLVLIKTTSKVLADGLAVCGIEIPEVM